jgi:hypothetical protein
MNQDHSDGASGHRWPNARSLFWQVGMVRLEAAKLASGSSVGPAWRGRFQADLFRNLPTPPYTTDPSARPQPATCSHLWAGHLARHRRHHETNTHHLFPHRPQRQRQTRLLPHISHLVVSWPQTAVLLTLIGLVLRNDHVTS